MDDLVGITVDGKKLTLAEGSNFSASTYRDALSIGEKSLQDLLWNEAWLLNLGGGKDKELLPIAREVSVLGGGFIDILAIDKGGNPVVVEVKRDAADEAGRREHVEMQASRYAPHAEAVTLENLVELMLKYQVATNEADALEVLATHIDDIEPGTPEVRQQLIDRYAERNNVRILLIASGFNDGAVAAFRWLRRQGVDLVCIRLTPYSNGITVVLQRGVVVGPQDDTGIGIRPLSGKSSSSIALRRIDASRLKNGEAKECGWIDAQKHLLELLTTKYGVTEKQLEDKGRAKITSERPPERTFAKYWKTASGTWLSLTGTSAQVLSRCNTWLLLSNEIEHRSVKFETSDGAIHHLPDPDL
ncbi:MAG: DUF91 domain-containing protein [Planctomycetes bacterium]|nr:DUF91 domain-containing protein [Planctomycetota bacterium]